MTDSIENDAPASDEKGAVKDFAVPSRRRQYTRAGISQQLREAANDSGVAQALQASSSISALQGDLVKHLGVADMVSKMSADLADSVGVAQISKQLGRDITASSSLQAVASQLGSDLLKDSGLMSAVKSSGLMGAVTADLSKSMGLLDNQDLGAHLFPGLDTSGLPESVWARDPAVIHGLNLPEIPPNPIYDVLEVLKAEREDHRLERAQADTDRERAAADLAAEKRKNARREAAERVRAIEQRRKDRISTVERIALAVMAAVSTTAAIIAIVIAA